MPRRSIVRRATRAATHRSEQVVNRYRLRKVGIQTAEQVVVIGRPILSRFPGSKISIGERSVLISKPSETAIGTSHPVVIRTVNQNSRITIGADVGMSGATICAACSITIGDESLLGADCIVIDTDFHPIDSPRRRYAPPTPPNSTDAVVIGRNVFIGTRSIILKGTTIGDNSVVGAGAIVKGHFPANSVIAGNPAREVSSLSHTRDNS